MPESSKSMVGMKGKTVGSLTPDGIVMIDDKEFPAQSTGTWIGSGMEVVVVEQKPFGLIVRPSIEKTGND